MRAEVAVDILAHCDRTRSKEARYALKRLVWTPLQKLGVEFAHDCHLSQRSDILDAQEAQKVRHSDYLWECLLCGKKFKSEHYLDKHLARNHAAYRHEVGTTCFAELCGVVIPCIPTTRELLPPVSSALLAGSSGAAAGEMHADVKSFCMDDAQKRRRLQSCTAVLHRCFESVDISERRKRLEISRMQTDLCKRAVEVECIPRNEVRRVLGDPAHVLRPGTLVSHRVWVGWGLAVSFVIILTVSKWLGRKRRGKRDLVRRTKVRRA